MKPRIGQNLIKQLMTPEKPVQEEIRIYAQTSSIGWALWNMVWHGVLKTVPGTRIKDHVRAKPK